MTTPAIRPDVQSETNCQTVLLNFDGYVATITLNRPDRLNAITPEMDEALRRAFETAFAHSPCRAIVLTGAGRGFCSGAERGSPSKGPPSHWQPIPASLDQFRFNYLIESPVPVIAAINGAAIGVGLVLACYCDIRLAVQDVKLGLPYSRLGLVAEYGIAKVLSDLVGQSRARELLLSGRQFKAQEAQEMGLVSHIAPAETFDQMVKEYVTSLAYECSPVAMRAIRRQLHAATHQDLLACAAMAGSELEAIRKTNDYTEALNARRDKRPPMFTGT
ncbi:enoyl-CoA hydratase/isomerase family protein [Orrella marina]|uniref:Enoyl-CoA hydratase n=1 Tax=Orrella marina TaxID=2163011 RepID=A0A2R4XFD5_9BURK|nr:enoyl-CoA hydratase-related protein [Orrella marina]AWB32518.1 enoyl-CoA hydratase [Orrella marina]